ncbi:restriction endonuclease subunit S, partial [Anaerotruncus colihominis]|uniref:restriction endonuclease subunit S n=1 Tax=Anaerotruncus colihominis TaxID=169435 RepID=UPI001362A538
FTKILLSAVFFANCMKEFCSLRAKLQRTKAKGNDYKVLSAINTGQLQLSEEYFTKQVFSKSISNYIVVEPFDFAYNPARINIGSIGMNTFGFTGCVSPIYVVIRCEPEYHYFLDFFIKSKRFSEEVKTRASGSVRQSLNYTDFGQIKIACPPIDVIERFNREYEVRLKTIEHLKGENKRLSSIRDTLLPKLMSGEIDVSAIQV